MSSLLTAALPPPLGGPQHVDGGSLTSPRRRNQAPQPPALTTSLSGLQLQGSGLLSATATPSTSLSSPFSLANPSPYTVYTPSPGGALRGSSPMASRQSGGYTAAYNPQEWGPVAGSPQVGAGPFPPVHQHDPPAPPPYSPQRQDPLSRSASSTLISAGEIASSGQSQHNTPISATAIAPTEYAAQQVRSRPVSMIYGSESPSTSWQSSLPPPPPPPSNRAARSPSGTVTSRPDGLTITSPIIGREKQAIATGHVYYGEMARQDGGRSIYLGGPASTAEAVLVPPSSKRAASTSAIGPGGISSRGASRSGSKSPSRQAPWDPTMPLPGPPPGPPPSSSRSQSASGTIDRFPRHMPTTAMRPRTRQALQMSTSLGPVPPTPAGWIDSIGQETDSATDSARTRNSMTLSPVEIMSSATPSSPRSDVASTFFAPHGKRDTVTKGIRERRSESRSAQDHHTDDSDAANSSTNPWADSMGNVTPADLTLPLGGCGLSRRRTITKSKPKTPGSSRSATLDDQPPNANSRDSQMNSATGSSRTTPRPDSGRPQISTARSIHTPPFSPGENPSSPQLVRSASGTLPPKSLPTPPPHQSGFPPPLKIPPSNLQIRPISHILHLPNDVTGMPAPLSPKRLPSTHSTNPRFSHLDHDSFVQDALDRTRAFLEKEHNAENDEERLRLFSDYILAESRIRRRRYALAFNSFDARLTRDKLFELNMHAPRRSSGLQETTIASPIEPPSPHPLNDVSQRRLESSRPDQGRPESMWWSGYQPALSPIASMSMNDEQSSRGRAPSRWWESQTGSESGGGARRIERSKRESKYMGLPLREVQQAMDGEDFGAPGPSQVVYAPDEYPPEKVGWHEDEPSTTPAIPPPIPTPHAAMDVSRLVTLPPPYPRHYPAVQNSHPDLLSYRTLVRTVSDLSVLNSRRSRYKSSTEALQKEHQARITENRRNFRINIQAQIQEGSISYAEAAEAEAALKTEEHAAQKTRVQSEFDSFQDVVLNPLHDLLNDRIAQTSTHISSLHSQLLTSATDLLHNPNTTQSAGDERPELLEQLTVLKWLFEAREQLHRELFTLLSERNSKYQAIVTLPYTQTGNSEKIRETTAFFAQDTRERTITFENEVLKRHERFLGVVEENVLRGVEAQLNAFWDIAPGIWEVCMKVPERNPNNKDTTTTTTTTPPPAAGGVWSGIHIPALELQENPSYRDHPMQYLYSLLLHAERSTYQFIESQINLLCLLHEARTGVLSAKIRVWEVQQQQHQNPPDVAADARAQEVKDQARQKKEQEEKVLTADLKDRVATVEGQWTEALGSAIVGTRERVRAWLVEEGGWDKELLDDGE